VSVEIKTMQVEAEKMQVKNVSRIEVEE